ncbi:uncharacterized protein LOC127836064 isoform X2 [Dreissena polymorpha]|uniref:uncharacterized protein LOC127836064 isoform X2 n=1 Tax=Dreissena polymorpha TaxID=45954 RepID=UPI00226514F0|nr:uncharacterized protein LOC127836064 isoform X2 [Dreissena polymorpha]
MASSQPVWIQKETMSLTIMIMLGVLLTNVFGAKPSDSFDNRVEKFEMLLQNMSEQLNNEHQARIEMEKQLNNEHQARIEMKKQLNNEHQARVEMEKQLNNEHQARVEMEKQLNNEHLARMELEKKLATTEAKSIDVIANRFERLENALENMSEQLNDERLARKQLENQLAEERRRHFQSRQLAEGTEIAFYAHVSQKIPHQGAGQIIRFEQGITSIDSTNSAAG